MFKYTEASHLSYSPPPSDFNHDTLMQNAGNVLQSFVTLFGQTETESVNSPSTTVNIQNEM